MAKVLNCEGLGGLFVVFGVVRNRSTQRYHNRTVIFKKTFLIALLFDLSSISNQSCMDLGLVKTWQTHQLNAFDL